MPSLIGITFWVSDLLELNPTQAEQLKTDLAKQEALLGQLDTALFAARTQAEINSAYNNVLDLINRDPSIGEHLLHGVTKDASFRYTPQMFLKEHQDATSIHARDRDEFHPDAVQAFFSESTIDTPIKTGLSYRITSERLATKQLLAEVIHVDALITRAHKRAAMKVAADVAQTTVTIEPPQARRRRM